MNKSILVLSLLMLASAALVEGIAQDDGVRIETKDSSGHSTGIVPVNLDTKISFTSEGMVVFDSDTKIAEFTYENCATITFLTSQTGIEAVEYQSGLVLLTNPAYDQLLFSGAENMCSPLAVFNINGDRMLYVKEWHGQPVEVSNLTPGIYLIYVNNSTFKFIKK